MRNRVSLHCHRYLLYRRNRLCRSHIVVGCQFTKQSVPIAAYIVASILTIGEVYILRLYVMRVVTNLQHVGGFIWVLWFHLPNNSDIYDLKEIFLKMAINPHISPNISQPYILGFTSVFYFYFWLPIWYLQTFPSYMDGQICLNRHLYITNHCL